MLALLGKKYNWGREGGEGREGREGKEGSVSRETFGAEEGRKGGKNGGGKQAKRQVQLVSLFDDYLGGSCPLIVLVL
jgi:hypothetical protein